MPGSIDIWLQGHRQETVWQNIAIITRRSYRPNALNLSQTRQREQGTNKLTDCYYKVMNYSRNLLGNTSVLTGNLYSGVWIGLAQSTKFKTVLHWGVSRTGGRCEHSFSCLFPYRIRGITDHPVGWKDPIFNTAIAISKQLPIKGLNCSQPWTNTIVTVFN